MNYSIRVSLKKAEGCFNSYRGKFAINDNPAWLIQVPRTPSQVVAYIQSILRDETDLFDP